MARAIDIKKLAGQPHGNFHCALCIEELPAGVSPREWARLGVFVTQAPDNPDELILCIDCTRHDAPVTFISLGQQQGVSGAMSDITQGLKKGEGYCDMCQGSAMFQHSHKNDKGAN